MYDIIDKLDNNKMKILITIFLTLVSPIIVAQQKTTRTSSHIDNDGKKLKIELFAHTNKGVINYKNEFDINGMSREQVDEIINQIKDSLGFPKENRSEKEKAWNEPSTTIPQSANKELWQIAEKFNAEMIEQFNNNNMLAVAQFYSDDATIYHPGKIYQDREAINEYWQDVKGAKNWKLTIKEVGGNKQSFWVTGLSELTVINKDGERISANNYIVIMQPDKSGKYKIYKDIYNHAANK